MTKRGKQNTYVKAYRARHKAEGLCILCAAPAVLGKTMCQKHLEKRRLRDRRNRGLPDAPQERYCQKCGAGIGTDWRRKFCPACAAARREAKKRAWYAKIYYERTDAETCARCGKPTSEGTLCRECASDHAERSRTWWQKKRAAGLCAQCGKPAMAGIAMCAKCAEKSYERQRIKRKQGKSAGAAEDGGA